MIPGSANALLLGSAGGYEISRSLRFNSADSAYLSRTPASAGNRKTWTWAVWVKRSGLGVQDILNITAPYADDGLIFTSNNEIEFYTYVNGYTSRRTSTALFRDLSAWMHVVVAWDTTEPVAADRVALYVNGLRLTQFTNLLEPIQNLESTWNQISLHYIGRRYDNTQYLSGYLADIHFIDGQALDPTSFGEFDANGIWQPIEYTGTYGTNGFHLDFSDNSAATAAALGADSSGNGHNWTPNNLSVTAGAGNDSLVDVPTNGSEPDTGVGGEVRGNYCTCNPLQSSGMTLSNGNLEATYASGTWGGSRGTIYVSSGKWYWELTIATILYSVPYRIGIANPATQPGSGLGGDAGSYSYDNNGAKQTGGTNSSYGASYTGGDVIGVALDLDSGTLTYYKNGTSQGQAFSGISGSWTPAFEVWGGETSGPTITNFGQRPFAYQAPSGYKSLCTANLPAPTIEDGSDYMDAALYSGNDSTQTISGLKFSPDFLWIKARNNDSYHVLYDQLRGAGNCLFSWSNSAEYGVSTDLMSAFNSDGFSVNTDGYNYTFSSSTNRGGFTYVAWHWNAGGSTVTNNDGSISSQVRANTSAGFSVVTGTAPASGTFTYGHGLGVVPSLIIFKDRDDNFNWYVHHSSICQTSSQYLRLNFPGAVSSITNVFGSALPTSSVVGALAGTTCALNSNFVAYCFAPVDGYSAFGSYTGNGSTDGPFVYLGFRPALVLIKASSGTSANWVLYDYKRLGYNANNNDLLPNRTFGESSQDYIDFTSNGFKLRSSNSLVNSSGPTYTYSAFAENPFALARAR